MISTIILLTATLTQAGTLSLKDFGETPSIDRIEVKHLATAMVQALNVAVALSNPVQRRVILSGMLCDAVQRKNDIEIIIARGLTKRLARASLSADKNIEDAKLKLREMKLPPLPCGNRDVEKLTECLVPVPPLWCEMNPNVSTQIAAAELISDGDKPAITDSVFPALPSVSNQENVDPWEFPDNL
jgi:hypothetical protein